MNAEECIADSMKYLDEMKTRDSHITIGIVEKMGNDERFDNQEKAYFMFLEAIYLALKEKMDG